VTSGPLHELWSALMFGKDGEEHDRIRRVVAAHFTPRAIEKLRPVTERIADALLDEVLASGVELELWNDYALPLAAKAQAALLGLPESDLDRIVPWALALVEAFVPTSEGVVTAATEAAAAFTAYLDEVFDGAPSEAGTVLETVRADTTLDRIEQRALVANLMFGGLDATAKTLTTTVHLLATNPDQLAAAGGCPIEQVVAEGMRMAPPLAGVARVALAPVDLGACRAQPGDLVLVTTVGLTGDPVRYPDPERFDVTRTPGKQLAFGAGPHYCLGANLAKLVLHVGLATLVRRTPTLRLDGEAVWGPGVFGGIVHLPLTTG
jgi:cytochrome P450